MTECAFDIVSGQAGRVLADAELLVICQEVIQAIVGGGDLCGSGSSGETRFFLRLCHGSLLHGLLLHCLVPEAVHDRVVEAVRAGWAKPLQLTGRLQSLGLADAAINTLMQLLAAEASLSQLSSLLRVVTRRRSEAADWVKAGLAELKAIETTAFRLGLRLELQYSVRSLFPASAYGGLTVQLIRVMPGRRGGSNQQAVDIIAAGGRYDTLVDRSVLTLQQRWRPDSNLIFFSLGILISNKPMCL